MKRYFVGSCWLIGYFLTEIINWTFLLLDNLFYPGYKKIEIKSPLFIIGMPRSASVLCLDLIGSDTGHYTSFRLWEILFAPSVIQKKLINLIIRLDHKMNRFIYRIVFRFDRLLFSRMDNHHPMSLFKREEDIFLFLHIFDSPALDVLIPRVTRAILFKRFDDEIPEHRKKRQMNFYKSCIRRHLYVYGRGKCYLSKSPPNTPRIKTLQSTFPGCRFILTLRDPFYCIASAISVIKQFRANFLLPSDDQKVVPAHLAMADLFYYYSLIECSELRGKQLYVVTFNEITKDAPHTLRNLYDHLGIEFTNEFERFLLDSTDFIHEHKTNHNYKPEDYGLLPEVIRKRYDYVYREFPDLKG